MDNKNVNNQNFDNQNIDNQNIDNQNKEQDSLDILYGKIEMTKKEKFKNFLHYHKSTIIFVAVTVVVFALLMAQVLSKTEPDVYMMYAGRFYIDPKAYDSIQEAMTERMGSDYNGDGKIHVEITNKTVKSYEVNEKQEEENGEELYTGDLAEELSIFRTEIAAGESIILFLDSFLYEDVADEGRLLPLEDALGYKPEGAIDDYGVYLKDTPFADACPEFESMLDNTVVCIKRRVMTVDEKTYKNNVEAFKKLFKESDQTA